MPCMAVGNYYIALVDMLFIVGGWGGIGGGDVFYDSHN